MDEKQHDKIYLAMVTAAIHRGAIDLFCKESVPFEKCSRLSADLYFDIAHKIVEAYYSRKEKPKNES